LNKDLKRVKELEADIEKYNYYYYVKNESLISDYEYDLLIKELEKLLENNLDYKSRILNKVGSSLEGNKFKKIEHVRPMLSLSNTYNNGDLIDFDKRVKNIIKDEKLEYVVELKYDGVSISIKYENGKLVQGLTRGDGEIGEDVTHNIIEIETIPKYLKNSLNIEVRGEIILPTESFDKINEARKKNGDELFSNARNAASGTLRQIDSSIVKDRKLDCFFYNIINDSDQIDKLKFLNENGFKTGENYTLCKNINEVIKQVEYWQEKRLSLPYETDGLVVKVNSFKLQNILGNTTKSPRWAIAYKFPTKQATTKLLGVTFQVGRTGVITPVAELEEVSLSGSIIRRASLYNFDEIRKKDIKIGDRVIIEKGGEIIPKVIMPIIEERNGNEKEIVELENCPSCNEKLIKSDTNITLICENINCYEKLIRKIEYFVSRDAMNIIGLGSKVIKKLIDLDKIKEIYDIYNLKEYREELYEIDKMGEKSISNLLKNIELSKNNDYSKVLFSLGIPFVGKYTANILAIYSKSIDNLKNLSYEELQNIEGVGDKIAKSIIDYFKNKNNLVIIERLMEHNIKFSLEEDENNKHNISIINNNFYEKTFLITGTLKQYKRKEAEDLIEKNGGKNANSVNKKLDYLVVGESPGSKLNKANELGIKIITEEDFIQLLK